MAEYSFSYHPRAADEADKLPQSDNERIQRKLKEIVTSEFRDIPDWGAEPMQAVPYDIYKIRIGDYRVAFLMLEEDCVILKIGPRRSFYKSLQSIIDRAADVLSG